MYNFKTIGFFFILLMHNNEILKGWNTASAIYAPFFYQISFCRICISYVRDFSGFLQNLFFRNWDFQILLFHKCTKIKRCHRNESYDFCKCFLSCLEVIFMIDIFGWNEYAVRNICPGSLGWLERIVSKKIVTRLERSNLSHRANWLSTDCTPHDCLALFVSLVYGRFPESRVFLRRERILSIPAPCSTRFPHRNRFAAS